MVHECGRSSTKVGLVFGVRFDARNLPGLLVGLLGATVAEAQGEPPEKDFVEYRPSARVRVIPDLAYAKYGNRTLLLDLHLPSQPGQGRPGVIVVRGGGWMVNDRKRFAHVASGLAERGVAAACIEYRTAEEAAFPGAIQDGKAAVRWMRANAARYGIDSQVIGTLGGSSGAHMAFLAGLAAGVAEFEGNGGHEGVSSQIQAVVSMATPTDLLSVSANNKRTVGAFLQVTPEQNEEKWRWASPVNTSPPEDLERFCCMGRRTIRFLRVNLLILHADIVMPGRVPRSGCCRTLLMRSGTTGLGSARPWTAPQLSFCE